MAAPAPSPAEPSSQTALLLMTGVEGDSTAGAAHGWPAVPSQTGSEHASALLQALQAIPQELARMILPGARACMLREVSKALKKAVENARPAVPIKVKRVTPVVRFEEGLVNLLRWCFIAAVDLSAVSIGAEGAGRLAAVLGQVPVGSPISFPKRSNPAWRLVPPPSPCRINTKSKHQPLPPQ